MFDLSYLALFFIIFIIQSILCAGRGGFII